MALTEYALSSRCDIPFFFTSLSNKNTVHLNTPVQTEICRVWWKSCAPFLRTYKWHYHASTTASVSLQCWKWSITQIIPALWWFYRRTVPLKNRVCECTNKYIKYLIFLYLYMCIYCANILQCDFWVVMSSVWLNGLPCLRELSCRDPHLLAIFECTCAPSWGDSWG